MIELSTLGVVEVKDGDGHVVEPLLAQPKRLALLIYLALGNTRLPHRRDSVVALFWPDLDQEHARAALRQAVRFLRSHLGEGVVQGRTEEELGVSAAALWCDVRAFEEACQTGRPEEALRLYRGAFLDGFHVADVAPEFEQWVDAERARLRQRAAEAAWVLAEQCRVRRDQPRAVEWARRAAALARDDEGGIRRLITFLDDLGDRAGAMHVYEDFALRLRQEFETGPAVETRALIDDLRSSDGTPEARHAPEPPAPPPALGRGRATNRPPVASRRRRWRTVLGVVAVAGAGGAGIFTLAHRPRVIPLASVIAVLPLAPSGPDTALSRLGRDLVLTLSASLDGVGDVRTVDAHTILAQWSDTAASPSLEEGRALGRRFGAGSVLYGSLVRVGPNVRADAQLVPTDTAAPLARVVVTAPPESVAAVTDSITWSLLRRIWRWGQVPLPGIPPALKTRSVPAVRAFLDGERAIVDGQWPAAAAAFARAVEADSGLWLAYFRYNYVRGWMSQGGDSVFGAIYRAHRFELPEPERLIIESMMNMGNDRRAWLALSKRVTERFPDNWFGWMDYGDDLTHWGAIRGYTAADARAALERAVALNPRLIPAWEHLLVMSLGRDTAATDRAIAGLTTLGAFSGPLGPDQVGAWPPGGERLADALPYFRLLDAAQRAGGRPDPGLADTIARRLAGLSGPGHHDSYAVHTVWFGLPQVTIEVSRRVLQRAVSGDLAAIHLRGMALAWAARGAWDSALVAMDRVVARATRPDVALEAYRLAVVGSWLGAVEPVAASARRGPLADALAASEPDQRAEVLWFDGLLAASQDDLGALSRVRLALERIEDSAAVLLRPTLTALQLAASGKQERAGRELAALEWSRADREPLALLRYPYLRAVNRLLASRWLLEGGDSAQAVRLLAWHEAELSGRRSRGSQQVDGMLSGVACLELARIHAAQGRNELARYYYHQFLQRYDMPVPAHRHLVEEARIALARLEGRAKAPTESLR